MRENTEELYYGYRVIKYISIGLIGGGIVGIALGITFTVLAYSTWVLALCWALGAILLLVGVFWQVTMGFTTDPRKIESIADNFLDRLEAVWDGKGKVLDIGTGRGRVAIEVAKRFPDARVIGMDIWPKMWSVFGQTKAGAEKNATIAKVGDRCTFQYGNALDLPFEDGEFQLVVSNFVFHEVNAPDRMILFKEIARALAPGGTF
jgi:SAM-dependent methyltransferase